MNTEENPNKAAAKLKGLYDGAVHMREAKVLLRVEDAAGVLAYIDELEAKVPAEPVRKFKVGDKVQEVTDDPDKPWGYVVQLLINDSQLVKLEDDKYAGRTLLYFDEEIEPYAEPSKFARGQKVREFSSGQIGIVLFEANGTYEVMFRKNFGTMSLSFRPDQLEAV